MSSGHLPWESVSAATPDPTFGLHVPLVHLSGSLALTLDLYLCVRITQSSFESLTRGPCLLSGFSAPVTTLSCTGGLTRDVARVSVRSRRGTRRNATTARPRTPQEHTPPALRACPSPASHSSSLPHSPRPGEDATPSIFGDQDGANPPSSLTARWHLLLQQQLVSILFYSKQQQQQ